MNQAIQKPRSHVFITGAYRSGTTLLHHLLDGHPALATFPVENCIFRDYLFARLLPNPKARNLDALTPLMRGADREGILKLIFGNQKLDLPLHEDIVLSGSTGNQVVRTRFDRARFAETLLDCLADPADGAGELDVKDVFDAYNAAYLTAVGDHDVASKRYLVNKCPEKGCCIEYYLAHFPTARIVHMLRDPRAVIASHKAGLPQKAFFPYKRFFQHVDIANDGMEACETYQDCDRVLFVRYEDLVTDIEQVMRRVAGFLQIDFDETLLQPTILRQPWASNTSFLGERTEANHVYAGNVDKFRKKLNELELQYIESVCNDAMRRRGYVVAPPHAKLGILKRRYMVRSVLSLRTHWFRTRRKLVGIFRTAW